jgi:hypothetical protein
MKRLESDPAVFIKHDKNRFYLMPCIVDDTLGCSTSNTLTELIHRKLKEKFRWKNLRECTWYLGMRVSQTYKDIILDQSAYLRELLDKFSHLNIKSSGTPAEPSGVMKPTGPDDIRDERFPYRIAVGSLVWLMKTRPDVAFAVSQVARHMSDHCARHHKAAIRILGYLKKFPFWGMGFVVANTPDTPWLVKVVVDSSFCNQPGSTSSYGYFTLMDGRPIAWRCKKNPSVCTSMCEAEYNGYCEGSKKCTFMKQFLEELRFTFQLIQLRGDSKSAKSLANSGSVSQRTKHIDLRCHYVQHNVIDKKVHGIE